MHVKVFDDTLDEDPTGDLPHRWQPELHRTHTGQSKLIEKEELRESNDMQAEPSDRQ